MLVKTWAPQGTLLVVFHSCHLSSDYHLQYLAVPTTPLFYFSPSVSCFFVCFFLYWCCAVWVLWCCLHFFPSSYSLCSFSSSAAAAAAQVSQGTVILSIFPQLLPYHLSLWPLGPLRFVRAQSQGIMGVSCRA